MLFELFCGTLPSCFDDVLALFLGGVWVVAFKINVSQPPFVFFGVGTGLYWVGIGSWGNGD